MVGIGRKPGRGGDICVVLLLHYNLKVFCDINHSNNTFLNFLYSFSFLKKNNTD